MKFEMRPDVTYSEFFEAKKKENEENLAKI
jgi:hypothetical protein